MVVLVLLIVGLAIDLWHLLSGVWPLLLVVAMLWLLWRRLALPLMEARAQAARDRLRHERARREIDRIALETSRAMYAAATRGGEVIEGTATKVEP
jgi:type VI protein secretion system component VasK